MEKIMHKPKAQRPANKAPKVEFNKGYWDGAIIYARGLKPTQMAFFREFNPFYEHGVIAGLQYELGTRADGGKAWNEFLATLRDPDLLNQVRAAQ